MDELLQKKLDELDSSKYSMSEHGISSQINSIAKDDDCLETRAERMAFGFCENYEERNTGWGTYFGPMMVFTGDDGKIYENPSLSLVTEEVVKYWAGRAETTNNPLMKARYYGLVFDLSNKTIGNRPDHQIALNYIAAIIDLVDNNICEHPTELIAKIKRAYRVSCSINNEALKISAIASAISLEDRIAEDDKAGLWGFCFDLFVVGKEKSLNEAQLTKLISDLEGRLLRVSKNCSPWVSESAAIPLATYYRSKDKIDDANRVIEILGSHFESACESAAPMLASSWYQHIHDIYLSFNLRTRAESVARKISEIGPSVVESMQTFSHTTEIPKEKMDAYLEGMAAGGLEAAMNRIAIQFLPKKGRIEQQVLELAKNHPLTYLFTKTLQDHKGRPVATIGGIEDDLEGNTIHQLSQVMGYESFFLRHSINKVIETYTATADDICNFIFTSPIFEESKKELIKCGISTFLNNDYTSSIHILIPQAEAAICALIEFSGGATLKKNRQGGLQLRTFDDLLRDQIIEKCFGHDSAFYFRVLLTDQRGWNLRNDTCHGINPVGSYNYATADRVLHVFLCLAQVRASNA